MASLSIRNLDENTKKRLRIRAAENGVSMEEEARAILRVTLTADSDPSESFGAAIRRIVEPLGGVELEPLVRDLTREPPDFSSEEFWS